MKHVRSENLLLQKRLSLASLIYTMKYNLNFHWSFWVAIFGSDAAWNVWIRAGAKMAVWNGTLGLRLSCRTLWEKSAKTLQKSKWWRAYIQNLNKIVYVYILSIPKFGIVYVFSQRLKNYIWEEFHNHLTNLYEKIKLIHFIFNFRIKIFKDISACGR